VERMTVAIIRKDVFTSYLAFRRERKCGEIENYLQKGDVKKNRQSSERVTDSEEHKQRTKCIMCLLKKGTICFTLQVRETTRRRTVTIS